MTDRTPTSDYCDGRYPVPQTSPPREEAEHPTYRCGLPKGHDGAHGPIGSASAPVALTSNPLYSPTKAAREWAQRRGRADDAMLIEAWTTGWNSRCIPEEPGALADHLRSMLLDGTVQCPLCGKTGPHPHSPEEIVIYRNGVKYGRSLKSASDETRAQPGVLEVGLNVEETMVILNHPQIDQDERGGYVLFTAAEARNLGALLLKKADECRSPKALEPLPVETRAATSRDARSTEGAGRPGPSESE